MIIYPQGLALLAAILVSSYLFWRQGVRKKFEEETLFDFVLVTLIGGIVGGRLFYFLFRQDPELGNFYQLLRFWQPYGMLWHGSLLGGFAAGSVFATRNFLNLKKIWDVAVPAILIGQALGSLSANLGESLFFAILFVFFYQARKSEFPAGFQASAYLILTSLLRFVVEFFRLEKTYLFGVNLNQIFSVAFLILGVIGLRWVYGGSKRDLLGDLKEFRMKLKFPELPLEKIKKRLSREEKKLERQQQELKKEDPLFEPGRTESSPELVAEAEEEIGHRRFAAVSEAVKGRLQQVKQALLRVKKGKYGVCERCGQKIDPARLKVDPSVTLCLNCQKHKEQAVGSR